MSIVRLTRNIGGKTIELETGFLAKQASGSVVATCGTTKVLAAVTCDTEPDPNSDIVPLTVDYREMAYASGKIPGSFFRREGRPTEREILISRLIDRPLRPNCHEGFRNRVDINTLAISFDQQNETDILAQVASAAALAISEVPIIRIIGSVRIGMIDGNYVINPLKAEMEKSTLDLVISGSREGICMVECGANQLDETAMVAAIEFARGPLGEVVALIEELVAAAGKPKLPVVVDEKPVYYDALRAKYRALLTDACRIVGKHERRASLSAVRKAAVAEFGGGETPADPKILAKTLADLEHEVLREVTLSGTRLDGRNSSQIRPISISLGYLGCAHGSAVFTRGETQSLSSCTLGTFSDEMLIDGIIETYYERFMLHYNFPNFSVGETGPSRGPRRREIGHGALAKRALRAVLPAEESFPYTIRLVSDVTESNGSSSMATVCGGTLALMEAAVPITAPVAGIAMGLICEGDRHIILTDILGDEDHFGDMDFKVAGTRTGITALQMDIKVPNISSALMAEALENARVARLFLLDRIFEACPAPKAELPANAPRIVKIKVNPEKIGKIIGPGGKMIRSIQDNSGAKVEIDDDGTVTIAAVGKENIDKARDMIEAIVFEPQLGLIYTGTVVGVRDFGCFLKIGETEGMCHVSEFTDAYVKSPGDFVKIGDSFPVKVINIEEDGKIRLSRKQAIRELGTADEWIERAKAFGPREPRPAGERNDRDRGDRGSSRGGSRHHDGDRRR